MTDERKPDYYVDNRLFDPPGSPLLPARVRAAHEPDYAADPLCTCGHRLSEHKPRCPALTDAPASQ